MAQVQLTEGAIREMSMPGPKPVLQVVDIQPVYACQIKNDRFRLLLSDGTFSRQGFLATHLTHLVKSGKLRKNSIVQLTEFACYNIQNRLTIIIVDLDVIFERCESLIGQPMLYPMANVQNVWTKIPDHHPVPTPLPNEGNGIHYTSQTVNHPTAKIGNISTNHVDSSASPNESGAIHGSTSQQINQPAAGKVNSSHYNAGPAAWPADYSANHGTGGVHVTTQPINHPIKIGGNGNASFHNAGPTPYYPNIKTENSSSHNSGPTPCQNVGTGIHVTVQPLNQPAAGSVNSGQPNMGGGVHISVPPTNVPTPWPNAAGQTTDQAAAGIGSSSPYSCTVGPFPWPNMGCGIHITVQPIVGSGSPHSSAASAPWPYGGISINVAGHPHANPSPMAPNTGGN